MNNQKKYQDEDSLYENSISKHGKSYSNHKYDSPDNIVRFQLAEPEPSSSILTVEPIRKQTKIIGKKRKRNDINEDKPKDNNTLTNDEFRNTIKEFQQDFKDIGLLEENKVDTKSSTNLGILLLSQNIFDFVRIESNKLNKTLENTFLKEGMSGTNLKGIMNKMKNTKDKRLMRTRNMINRFNNIDFSNSSILGLFNKIVNYYDNKINECDFEFDRTNWKDINIHKTTEKIFSYKGLLINKTKNISSMERLYDRVVSRSLIYLLNKKGRTDNELSEALCKASEVFDKKYVTRVTPKYLNHIESLYEGSDNCNNILKYILSLIHCINTGKDIPDDFLYSLFDEEEECKKISRKPKLEVQQKSIVCNDVIEIPAADKKTELSASKNIIKIDTSAFLDNKEIEKRIQEEKIRLFKPTEGGNNVLFNVNVNLNVNLNVNVTNNENGAKNTIIKIDYDALNRQINNQPEDDAITLTDSDKTVSASSVSSKSIKKKNKIFSINKVKREEFQLMPIKNINFEIRPTLKKNRKCITNSIINN